MAAFPQRTDKARFKVLRGVAHDLGASFTSLMNYATDDYSMGHILRLARETGKSTLTIDLLNGRGLPEELLRDPVAGLPEQYAEMLARLLESSGSDRALIQSARLTLVFDLERQRPSPLEDQPQSPYTCEVAILDIQGQEYVVRFDGWWFVEGTSERTTSAVRGCWDRRLWHQPGAMLRLNR